MKILERLAHYQALVERALGRLLPPATAIPGTIHEAMRYSALAPAKRLRPCMAILAGECLGASRARLAGPAAALELIHTYSLVHDDLPSMDDDNLRRGRPTCHVQFGEATAVLTGDALLTLAFEVLSREGIRGRFTSEAVLAAVLDVARAAGTRGLIGGQVGDLAAEGRSIQLDELAFIHARKTGALFEASMRLGGILAGGAPAALGLLARFGRLFGQVFQMTDDMLDVTGSSERVGKSVGSDERHRKATYPRILGLAACRDLAVERARQGARITGRLARLGRRAARPAGILRELILALPERTH